MGNKDGPEIFRGHLEECLGHYSKALATNAVKGTHKATLLKRPVADFCGATVKTVSRWLGEAILPVGEKLIRLMCFLDLLGYKVIELERMPKARRGFAELVGFGLLTSEEAAKLLSYAKGSSLHEILQGRHSASEAKKALMWEEWKKRREELEKRKEEYANFFRPSASAPSIATDDPFTTGVAMVTEGLSKLLEDPRSHSMAPQLKQALTTLRSRLGEKEAGNA